MSTIFITHHSGAPEALIVRSVDLAARLQQYATDNLLDAEAATRIIGHDPMEVVYFDREDGPATVMFVLRGVPVMVRGNSKPWLIYRDWVQVEHLWIDLTGPVGPDSVEIPDMDRLDEYGQEFQLPDDSLRLRRRQKLQNLAATRYHTPPAAGTMFDYWPRGAIHLITWRHFNHLPWGATLHGFTGRTKRKGIDVFDPEEEYNGFMTYGLLAPTTQFRAPFRAD